MALYLDPILEPANAAELTEGLARTLDMNLTQQFLIQDIGVSSRAMNNWISEGLMPTKLRVENSPYRFSFAELIWFNIVKELRDFGYPIPKIREVKNLLLLTIDFSEYFRNQPPEEKGNVIKKLNELHIRDENSKKQLIEAIKKDLEEGGAETEPVYTNLLNLLINHIILYREEIILRIDPDGKVIPIAESEKDNPLYEKLMSDMEFDRESYIHISLMKFFRKFVLNKNYFPFVRDSRILGENESHILSLLREGKAKAVTIRFKDQKPFMLEVTREKQIENETRLSEVFLKGGYQDISMKTENGSIVVTSITTKTRLNP